MTPDLTMIRLIPDDLSFLLNKEDQDLSVTGVTVQTSVSEGTELYGRLSRNSKYTEFKDPRVQRIKR